MGQMPAGSHRLWCKTLDQYTRAGLSECVVSTMSGPPQKTTQDRTQRTHTQTQDHKLKFLTSSGISSGPPGWKAGSLPTTSWQRIRWIPVIHFIAQHEIIDYTFYICLNGHRCGGDGSMRAYQAAGPGSIPGREKIPGWCFSGGFPRL